jgi:hypothetical protein
MVLAAFAGIVYLEVEMRKMKGRLNVCEEKDHDAQIREQVHALSDADLDAELDKDDGRGKPSA